MSVTRIGNALINRAVFVVFIGAFSMGLLDYATGKEGARVPARPSTMEALKRPIEKNPIYQAIMSADAPEKAGIAMQNAEKSASQADRDEFNQWLEDYMTMSGTDKRLTGK